MPWKITCIILQYFQVINLGERISITSWNLELKARNLGFENKGEEFSRKIKLIFESCELTGKLIKSKNYTILIGLNIEIRRI